MSTLICDLLDAIKGKHRIKSDYALAEFMGISRARISHYRKGRELPSDAAAVLIAGCLDADPREIAALIHAERAENEALRDMWLTVAEQFTEKRPARCDNGPKATHTVYYVKFHNSPSRPTLKPSRGLSRVRHIVAPRTYTEYTRLHSLYASPKAGYYSRPLTFTLN